jgi:ribulose-phosphate 3-epimerase
MAKTEIIPAILVNDFATLQSDMELVQGFVKTVQIDVCDGQFTSQPTWPYRKHDENFEKIVAEEEGLPGWENTNFEIDLMCNDPADKVENWVQAGATRIILHAEARGDIAKAIEMLQGRVEIGLAFNIDTEFEAHVHKLQQSGFEIQSLQFMGIDTIGFQKQPFDEKVLARVRDARMVFPGLSISVDGGVSLENAAALIDAGADRLIVGSAIFGAENPIDAIHAFKQLL